MKHYLIPAGLLLLVVTMAFNEPEAINEEKGIEFLENDWEEILKMADKEKKLIFMDIYATWCGPCKAMKKNTFSDKKVGAYFNEHFINVAMDGEKEVGQYLAIKYGIRAYPTVLFVDSTGKLVAGAEGYHNVGQLLSLGKKVQNEKH